MILNTLSSSKLPWLAECIMHTTYYGNYLTWFARRCGSGEQQPVTKAYYNALRRAMRKQQRINKWCKK